MNVFDSIKSTMLYEYDLLSFTIDQLHLTSSQKVIFNQNSNGVISDNSTTFFMDGSPDILQREMLKRFSSMVFCVNFKVWDHIVEKILIMNKIMDPTNRLTFNSKIKKLKNHRNINFFLENIQHISLFKIMIDFYSKLVGERNAITHQPTSREKVSLSINDISNLSHFTINLIDFIEGEEEIRDIIAFQTKFYANQLQKYHNQGEQKNAKKYNFKNVEYKVTSENVDISRIKDYFIKETKETGWNTIYDLAINNISSSQKYLFPAHIAIHLPKSFSLKHYRNLKQ